MEDLKVYCLPSKRKAKAVAFSACGMAVFVLILSFFTGSIRSNSSGDREMVILIVGGCLIAAAVLYRKFYTSKKKTLEKCIRDFGKNGLPEETVINDFRISRPHFDGQLRVGQYCLFPREKGYIFYYGEIESIGVKRIITNFTSGTTSTSIYLEAMKRSEFYELCRLDVCGNYNVQLSQFANYISLKAPNIRLEQGERVIRKRVDDTPSDDD